MSSNISAVTGIPDLRGYRPQRRDVRKPNANEVLIEVHSAGICGSDLHIHHDHINLPMRPPVVIGHEFSGTIIECGSEISRVKVGDRVTVEPTFSICGRCDYCVDQDFITCAIIGRL